MNSDPADLSDPSAPAMLAPPLAMHRVGEAALLADYPDTTAVLAAAAAVQELAPPHLIDLVPAERTLLLVGAAARDLGPLRELLRSLPVPAARTGTGAEVSVGIVYDGEDLAEVAELLDLSTQALISAHSSTLWRAAFSGFAPGFAYLVADTSPTSAPPWEVPRRSAPRTAVPAGAVGLASRYCGIYPRSSPGGWQLIGRSDAALFDVDRYPPALLAPGTRVRFAPQRPTARAGATASALSRAARGASTLTTRRERRGAVPTSGMPVLEVLSPGPLTLLEDGGRPGQAAIGVSTSGAFDQGGMRRANFAVGNPGSLAVLESVVGPLELLALAPTVVAASGAPAPLTVTRHEEDGEDLELAPGAQPERPIALDRGDRLTLGPATSGLRLVLAVRGGIRAVRSAASEAEAEAAGGDAETGAALGALSRDTLSGLGPAPLRPGDQLLAGPTGHLDAVPAGSIAPPDATTDVAPSDAPTLEIPVHAGPRDGLLGPSALAHLLATTWTVRPDSDRVGVRLDGAALPVPSAAGSLPSEPMVPGAIQVPPSGLPVVFGPDHPTTGGYPVLAVVTRAGLDQLAQASAGTSLHFVTAG